MSKEKHLQVAFSENEEQKTKTFEDVLEDSGGFGRFQALLLLFVLFYEIPSGFLAFVPIFVGSVPPEWKCETEVQGESSATISSYMSSKEICNCNGSRSAPPYTIVSEWNLICESSWIVPSITSLQMFGMLFGNTIPPQISDWYGRKVTFLILMIIMTVGQSASALATNPYFYAMGRFLCGIGLAGYFSLNGIYSMEFLTPKWRQLGGCLGPLGEGILILGILAYLIRPWRLLLWATTLPFITVIFVFPFLPESPRFLLRNNRISEAEGVIRYIARINGKKISGDLEGTLKEISKQEGGGGEVTVRYSYLDLFRQKDIRTKTFIFIGIWFCWALSYFGMSYNVRNFGVDPYLMTVLSGAVDAVGFRAALIVNNRLGRRKALILFTGASALAFLSVAAVQTISESVVVKYQKIFIGVILFGKLGVAGARSSVRVLTVESYPVSIRTMGFGVSRVSSVLGGVVAPQIAFIGSKWPSAPLFAFGIVGFLGSLLSLLLKETSGRPLQDQMQISTYSVSSISSNSLSLPPPPSPKMKNKVNGIKKRTKVFPIATKNNNVVAKTDVHAYKNNNNNKIIEGQTKTPKKANNTKHLKKNTKLVKPNLKKRSKSI